ncbi:MAG TPA: cellulase family glycosylhydrolase [Gaiellaceae bacterium]|nr:cellulase family glycosylhydrolase [Gaiellaceae bacterium]
MPKAAWIAVLGAVALLAAPAATVNAAPRMPIGFFDDISFRYSPDADANMAAAAKAGATVIHTAASWPQIAPTRPTHPLDADDPAYHLTDLDTLVREASKYGLRVMVDITGSPKWANGNQTPNHMPKKLSDLTDFAFMLAQRYDGKNPGKGVVSMWSIWNEPNLQQFLTPQYNSKGVIVSPAAYAKLYKAAYTGIKRANPQAQVAIGETSAQGRDKPSKGSSETVSPGTFAKLLGRVKGLKFDAWAHHPYPTSPGAKPLEKVRYPNVTLTQLPTFEKTLKAAFHKSRVPIWITEYGHETKPAERKGVSYSTQAAYAKQALNYAKADPDVDMFIWFTFRDNAGNPWQSGLEQPSGAHKASYNAFASVARLIDGTTQVVKAGRAPTVTVYVPYLAYYNQAGGAFGITYRVYDGKKLIAVGQPTSPMSPDEAITFKANFSPVKGKTYTVTAVVNDPNGNAQTRDVTLVAS